MEQKKDVVAEFDFRMKEAGTSLVAITGHIMDKHGITPEGISRLNCLIEYLNAWGNKEVYRNKAN